MWAGMVAAVVTVVSLVAPTAAFALPDPDPANLTAVASLSKTASAQTVAPGETFTYTITVGCSSITDAGCRGAVLSDVVPAPFVLIDAVVGGGANSAAEPVISGNTVTIDWITPLGDGTIGLLDATTSVVEITAQLPADASHDTNGIPVVNNAVIEGVNFADDDGNATVTPVVPLDLAVTAGKTLAPSEALATAGTAVIASLTGRNDSNATVDALVIQDPANPLVDPNPFASLGFVGFGAVIAPATTTSTTYEVLVGSDWITVNSDGTLPGMIDPTTVRGTRVTFDGDIAPGSTGSVALNLAVTDAAASSPDGTVVENTVGSTVELGAESATGYASDEFTLRRNAVSVAATKSFSPAVVVAGESSLVSLGARNTSTITIEQLAVREPSTGTFPEAYTFAGITSPVIAPAGATGAKVVYHYADGDPLVEELPFAGGTVPPSPSRPAAQVSYFEMIFTGAIAPSAGTEIRFHVATDPDLDPTTLPLGQTNEVLVTGTNAGTDATNTASDELNIYDEVIETYIGKTIRPSQILALPGEVVTVSLEGGLTERPNPPETPTGTTGSARQVVLQDPPDPVAPNAWWNAFDLAGVAQTPIPADAELTIEYYDTVSDTWQTLVGPLAGPRIYSGAVPEAISDIAGGIRFVYDYTGAENGFAPGTDFAPNFTSSLRPTGRYDDGVPFSDSAPTSIQNCAQADATSAVPGVDDATSSTATDECPAIEVLPLTPGNGDIIDKEFGTSSSGGIASVIARSGDTIPSTLRWSTGGRSGLGTVEVTDAADPAATSITASHFDSFDLSRISPITRATDPLIAFDRVTQVLLWNGSAWVPAANSPCPAACIGTYPGTTLTTPERASTTGVRLVFAESPRRAAASAGNLDAPAVGSGVARSFSNVRPVTLVWQVRDVRRSDATPVLGDEVYNLSDEGVVRNTARAEGFPQDGSESVRADDLDDVAIVDVPLTTSTSKTWSGGPLAVPPDPTVPMSQFPLSRVTVTTRNTTPARVDQLVITDPAPGSATTRQQDVFQAFRLNNFSQITQPAGTSSTVVTLFCPDGSSTQYERTIALGLTAATMPCDVSGIQVAFDGRISANAAGVVAFDVRLRAFWREQPTERVSLGNTPIANTAEGVVADVDPIGSCPPAQSARYACDQATAFIALASPSFGVTAAKTLSPSQQKEDDFSPVTVTISGQPTGSTRVATATLEDSDASFWNAFEFAGMDSSWAFVPPTGRVQVCYLAGGTFTASTVDAESVGGTWTCSPILESTSAATTFLASASFGNDIHGLRFQFWQGNDLGWQNPPNPTVVVPFTVVRRETLRTGEVTPTTRADQVAAPGEEEPGVFRNDVQVHAVSAEVTPGNRLTADASAPATYRNLHLEAAISVTKSPNGDVRPGVAIPYTLTFKNAGELPLIDPVFSDRLPVDDNGAQLILDPDRDPSVSPWTFALAGAAPSPASGPALPTAPALVAVEEIDDVIYFRMPAGAVLEPGQTYTIAIRLMLRPGLTPLDRVRNIAAIDVDVPLDACVPMWDAATAECYDDSVVQPLSIPALSTVKFVKADTPHEIPGVPAVFSATNGYACTGTADPEGFYRSPCVPVTRPGDTETWKFTVTNAGTVPIDQIVSIDNLPTPGDQGLIVQLPRGSEWEPTILREVALEGAPETATLTVFGSTSAVPCTADLNPLAQQCAPGTWFPIDAGTDLQTVRSAKFVVTFTPEALFDPGDAFSIRFQTRTTPNAAITSPYPTAWNTVATGGSATSGGARVVVPGTEGRRVGVAYPTGPVQLVKTVTGPAAELAPTTFPVQLVCESAGVEVLGLPEIVLVAGADPVEVPGLPWGSDCTATEEQWGQTSQVIGAATVGTPRAEVALVTVENIFDVADLTVRKSVESSAQTQSGAAVSYGPFDFSVTCFFGEQEVWATGYGPDNPMAASITPEQTWALADLPVGSECTVTETDTLDAVSTTMRVTGGEPVDGTSIDVTIVEGAGTEVWATNTFGSGSLSLEKVLAGDGAEIYGTGPFSFIVNCTLDTGSGQARVWAGRVSLGGELAWSTTIDNIAAGAECDVREYLNGGATSVEISPNPAIVSAGETVEVTATNTFDASALIVSKVVDGPGAALWGTGPFEVTLQCTTPLGAPVEIPGGAARSLSTENEYTATFEPLLVGLLCTLTETDAAGATVSDITDAEGEPVDGVFRIGSGDLSFTVTNTFEVGSVSVIKTVSGGAAAAHTGDRFGVGLTCTWNGSAIEVPGGAQRVLTVAEPVTYDDLPVGAECVVRETDAGSASAVTLTPADPADSSRALVTVGAGAAASITIDNRFDPPLPATGGEAATVVGWTVFGTLVLGGGLLLVMSARRRRLS